MNDDTEDWPFIKTTRSKLDISQAELASIVGVDATTVCEWEADAAKIGPYHRAMLGKLYSASYAEAGLESVSESLTAHGAMFTLWRLLGDGSE